MTSSDDTAAARFDHAYAAQMLIEGGIGPSLDQTRDSLALAQVHATLALVEQQRIANLIAVAQMEGGPYKAINNWTRSIKDADGYYIADGRAGAYVEHQIREGLGL